jgi:dienelactone hydrolase
VLVAAALVATACSSGGPASTAPAATTASTPQYQRPGPDTVGVTTLDLGSAGAVLGERLATVYYPADPATAMSHPRFSYSEASTLPTQLQGLLPPRYDTITSTEAYTDSPGSTRGPFPVVLFSHGFGGERLQYSNLLTGVASWGYVVVSADYLERGLAVESEAGLGVKVTPTSADDQATMGQSLARVESASEDPASVLHGLVDPSKVAAMGHSAGGGTAFTALHDPRVATAIGWSPEQPTGGWSSKPVMLIAPQGDLAFPPAAMAKDLATFPGPRSWVEISGEGHNSYTDICVGIRDGGGLVNYAVQHHFTTAALERLATNGCEASDLPPQRFWPVVQYYSVFQLEAVFHHGPTRVPTPAPGAFPGFTVTVHQAG